MKTAFIFFVGLSAYLNQFESKGLSIVSTVGFILCLSFYATARADSGLRCESVFNSRPTLEFHELTPVNFRHIGVNPLTPTYMLSITEHAPGAKRSIRKSAIEVVYDKQIPNPFDPKLTSLIDKASGNLVERSFIQSSWESALTATVESYTGRVDRGLRAVVKAVENQLNPSAITSFLVVEPRSREIHGMLRLFRDDLYKSEIQSGLKAKLPCELINEARGLKVQSIEKLRNERVDGDSILEFGKFHIDGPPEIHAATKRIIQRVLLNVVKRDLTSGLFIAHVATAVHAKLYEREYGFKILEILDLTPWYLRRLADGDISREEFESAKKTEYILSVDPWIMEQKLLHSLRNN